MWWLILEWQINIMKDMYCQRIGVTDMQKAIVRDWHVYKDEMDCIQIIEQFFGQDEILKICFTTSKIWCVRSDQQFDCNCHLSSQWGTSVMHAYSVYYGLHQGNTHVILTITVLLLFYDCLIHSLNKWRVFFLIHGFLLCCFSVMGVTKRCHE